VMHFIFHCTTLGWVNGKVKAILKKCPFAK
jgi:hypothetical protein